jgi:hypothetical protein
MPLTLNDVERRVLSVLIEKSLTQPSLYPMTIHSITQGANQKHNRDPVMELTEGDVARAIQSLQHKQLLAQAPPNPGDRANKFKHCVVERFHWDPREQAVMAELLLRGRQTPGDLRTRASRMCAMHDLEGVMNILEGLRNAPTPFVEELPREPGQSANRYRHLFSADEPQGASGAAVGRTSTQESASTAPKGIPERLALLEAQVAHLMRAVSELQRDARRPSLTSDDAIPISKVDSRER